MKWLILILIAVPALELALLIWAANNIGVLLTVGMIIATGVLGAFLAKKQGMRAIGDIQKAMANFEPPGENLLNAAFVLVGGVLLLTPGFISDAVGFSMLFTPTQKIYKPLVHRFIHKKMKNTRVIVS
ncbi:FxsA family protein [Planococcus beigongshangi]|uniref:FxsA family protein n=1 Tax=Planococcus beigongshangi TaxID=2782536 RepID=UPI00193BA98C|nr:FxsA family protein [Planococcus beigongshangi]